MTRTISGRTDRVVVVGAGLSGLSAAMHLRGAGREVTLLERAPTPGGRAPRVVRPASSGGGDFRLDIGPTVLTMPDLIEDCFDAVGESMDDWLTLNRLEPAYRAEFADGTGLSVGSDIEQTADRIAAFAGPKDAAGYRRYVDYITTLYRVQMRTFIDRNLDSPLNLVGTPLARLVAMRGFARLAPTVARYVSDERLQRVLSFQALYAGVSPEQALAIYAVISYMDLVEGVYYPVGGMNALPTAMADAATKAGVEMVYDTTVSAVRWSGDRVTSVTSQDGREWAADAVVLTLDVPAARALLGRPSRRLATHYSPSCVVLGAGLRGTVRSPGDAAAHHTMHFGRAWSGVFEDLESGRLMRDPSFLVSLPSVTDPSIAPPGDSVAYVLFPTPHLDHDRPLDWDRLRGPYRDTMLAALERAGYTGFEAAIDAEVLVTPKDWADQGLAAGTPFAAAHTFTQTGPFRSRNLVADNVVLAGSATVPGVGVPMVLISGRLAAERVTGADPAYRSRAWR